MDSRLTSSHFVLGREVKKGEATQSHLYNAMPKLTFTESPVGQAEKKAGAGPGSGATQNAEPEAIFPVQGAEAQRGQAGSRPWLN